MRPTFAIFTMLPNGEPFWIESVENLEDARERLREVARNISGDCFIYSAKRGVVELINTDFRERLGAVISGAARLSDLSSSILAGHPLEGSSSQPAIRHCQERQELRLLSSDF
jgi:hypothetical protein